MAEDGYAYITLPWKRTEPIFNRYNLYSLNWAVEANFRGRNCAADYVKLIDGTMLYRIFQSKLWLFRKDTQGYYMDLLTKGLYRFTYEDPSLNVKRVWDWLPI
jgi:hypothetical protein